LNPGRGELTRKLVLLFFVGVIIFREQFPVGEPAALEMPVIAPMQDTLSEGDFRALAQEAPTEDRLTVARQGTQPFLAFKYDDLQWYWVRSAAIWVERKPSDTFAIT